jgi:hypothetical protein
MPVTPESTDHDKLAKTDIAIFAEASERLRICTDAESENRIKGINALNFRNGEQWDADIANNRKIDQRPALTINRTNTFCRRVENTLKQQRPRIKCHPVGGGARVEDANVVNGLIRHIETLSNAGVAYDAGGASAINIGWGYWRIVGDYVDEKSFDQELKILPIRNTFTVYMDPCSVMPDGSDQGWCIISETMKRTEYKRKYPNAKNCEWQTDAPGDMQLEWENKEEIRLAEYYRIYEVSDTLYQMNDGSVRLKSALPDEAIMAATGYMPQTGPDGKPVTRKTSRRQVEWYRINGREIVDRRVIPGRFIPVIRCEGNVLDVNGRVHRKGMVADLMDPARMFNYWRTAQTERYALTPKAPWVAAEGQIEGHPEWQQANQKSFSTLIYKPIPGPDGVTVLPAPQRQMPAQVEAGMTEAAAGAEQDLMAVAGMPAENPEITARIVGGNKYLQRKQGMQDLVHWHYYDNQTLAIRWTGYLLLELIPYYYDTERMQRIIGDDQVPQMVKINEKEPDPNQEGIFQVKNNLQLGRFDVVMDTGPGYQTKREEGAASMMELLGTPLGEPIVKTSADIVVRNMDFSGADEVADRLVITNDDGMKKAIEGLPKQAQAIVVSLQQKIQQQDELLKNQALEIKYKGDVERMKDEGQTRRTLITSTSKAHDTEKKAEVDMANAQMDFEGWLREIAEWRHQALVNRDTKLDVAEIQASAQLLNTHAEAAHESRAADKLIKAGADQRAS